MQGHHEHGLNDDHMGKCRVHRMIKGEWFGLV